MGGFSRRRSMRTLSCPKSSLHSNPRTHSGTGIPPLCSASRRNTMLRNVLGAYLDSVTERALDLPFMALLAAMGFVDIHYTHGQVEFGKDFIAKRIEAAGAVQYSFQ